MTKIQQWKRCNPLGENLISQLLLEVGGWDADGEDLARRGLRTGNFWWATKITFWNWVWPLTPVAKVLKSTTRKTLAVLMEFKTISFWDKICLSFWWMSWVLEWSTKGNLWLKPQLTMDPTEERHGVPASENEHSRRKMSSCGPSQPSPELSPHISWGRGPHEGIV